MGHTESQISVGPLEVVFAIAVVGLTVFVFLRLGPLEGLFTVIVGVAAAYVLAALWNPPEPKPPPPEPAEQENPVGWAIEHQHRYDPGYWTGGRLDPVLRARRSSRSGLSLLFGSLVTLVLGAFVAATSDGSVSLYMMFVFLSAVELAAGWALLRRKPD